LRLAIVTSHPIQYYAPWFRDLAARPGLDLRVFYLWDFGVTDRRDPRFGTTVRWDVPLLDGYAHEFVPNWSPRAGTERFGGLINPGLFARLERHAAQAVLVLGYAHASTLALCLSTRLPLLLRGDSHRLVESPASRWREMLKRRVFARAAACLYVGEANRRFYRHYGVDAARLFFSPHAIDNARFAPHADHAAQGSALRAELGVPDTAPLWLFAGKFESKKRPLDLLRAWHAAAPAQAHLLLVGNGALETALRAQAAGNARVHFLPFQNQSRMPAVYSAADALVLPSYGAHETWGLAVNEAMAAGKPALVSDHVGCHLDLIDPERTGWTFPAGDVDALGALLARVGGDRAQLAGLGQAAAARVANYSYTHASEGVMAALRRIGGAA
jgi:glycosyltransferase involved in cell wall biosynthesis